MAGLIVPAPGGRFAALLDSRLVAPLLRGRPSTLTASVLVAAAYSIAGGLGVALLRQILAPSLAGLSPSLGIPWLAAGIGVSGLLLFGVRAWPGVLVGCWVTWGVLQGDSWPPVLVGGFSEVLSILAIVWMLRAWGYRPSLERYQDALILVVAVAVGRLLTSACDIIGLLGVAWFQTDPRTPLIADQGGVNRVGDVLVVGPALLTFALRWWANTTFGVVLVVPLLAFAARSRDAARPGARAELACWGVASLVWLAAALSASGLVPRLTLLAVALALVLWAATRFGVAIASLGTLLFSVGSTLGFALQLGVFAGIGGREALEVQWGFIGVLTGAGLFLTALQSSRSRVRHELAAAAERYRRLFLANPSPMWVEDVATGRILVVNDAAVRVYGYTADEFLRLSSREFTVGEPGMEDSRRAESTAARSVGATHRTADGRELRVEVSEVRLELHGAPVRTCSIDIVDERNDLRLAVLNATDAERERLGREVRGGLVPVLGRLEASVDALVADFRHGRRLELPRLAPLEHDASLATTICRQLTRGASPMQAASGDLIDALRGLPQALLSDDGPDVEVSVRSMAPVALSLERAEHVYRIAHEAVRAALFRPGVSSVHVTVDVTRESVGISVEDDGLATAATEPVDRLDPSPLAIRAAAAQARFFPEPPRAEGHRVRFECRQSADTVPVGLDEAPAATAPDDEPIAPESPARDGLRRARVAVWTPWLHGLVLLLAYVATAKAGLLILQQINAPSVTWLPRLAFPWVPNGVAVVGLLLGGTRLAPAIFFASAIVWGGLVHDSWVTVCVDAVGEMLCAITIVRLLARWGFRRSFNRALDLGLVVAAAAVGRTIPLVLDLVGLHLAIAWAPGTLGPATLAAIAEPHANFLGITPSEIGLSVRWWINGVAGIALVVPLAVPRSALGRRVLKERWLEAALLLLGVAIATALVAVGPSANWRLPLLALGVVIVSWPSIRFGVGLASACILVLSLGATAGYSLGMGPFARVNAAEGAEVLWGFIGLLAATGLFLATVVASYDTAVRALVALRKRYASLFEALPHPVFAFGAADGRITAVNADALRKYGYSRAEFLKLRPADLDGRPEAAAAPFDPSASGGRTLRPGVHRTRVGTLFDVELSVTPVNVGRTTEMLCFAVDVTERNELRRRVLEASDLERRRLAHELHDGLGQILTGLALGLASVRRALEERGSPNEADLSFVGQTIRDARRSCDQIVHGLSPLDATNGDLVEALRNLPAQLPPGAPQQLRVTIRGEPELRLPLRGREHLYQIARECVNNALKHSDATRIEVRLEVGAATVTLVVADDGHGFDPYARSAAGLGLRSLRVRTDALRGRLSFERPVGGGMSVSCRCPRAAA